MAKDPNLISFKGRLVKDPELRATKNGVSVCDFAVASSGRSKSRTGEWQDGEPTYWECEAWRELAEHITDSLHKGSEVIVQARPKPGAYTRNGVEIRTTTWIVEAIGPSLFGAIASITRTARGEHPAPPRHSSGRAIASQPETPPNDPYADPYTDQGFDPWQ
jgi:single-strand DNA-binding protein